MKVVMPATPYDAKGLFTAAIREEDPVVVFAPSAVMGVRGPVPEGELCLPLGRSRVRRSGSDVTVVVTAPLLGETLKLASRIEEQGISVEVLDPCSLLPFDHSTLEASVAKTSRLVVFDDSNRTCGFAAEVSAFAGESLFPHLRAPIVRITRSDVPVPFSTALDKHMLPNADQLEAAIYRVMEYRSGSARRGAQTEVLR
jgi:pyruvate dehydrogenase E1 component beta subunit